MLSTFALKEKEDTAACSNCFSLTTVKSKNDCVCQRPNIKNL